jgi:protein-S-isoprenylcysteine O-methyltransferase Ste14
MAMFPPTYVAWLIGQEERKKRLREAEHDRLVREARGGRGRPGRALALIYLAALLTVGQMVLAAIADEGNEGWTRYLAPAFGLAGLCLVFWPMFALHRHGQAEPVASYMQATVLVDLGPYAVVRHPQYLGYMCLNATFMLASPRWPVIVLGSLAISLFCLYALREEQCLVNQFGYAYQAYMGRVPRLNILLGLVRFVRHRRSSTRLRGPSAHRRDTEELSKAQT